MPNKSLLLEESEKLKAVRRQKKKSPKMKVSGRSVILLKKIVENKHRKSKKTK